MAYRDDVEALHQRESELVAELKSLRQQMDAAAGLAQEQARLREELAYVRAAAPIATRLPALRHLRLASPCSEEWKAMPGDDRVRHCQRCGKNVYNLEAMTQREALSLLEMEREPCMRLRRRTDGTVVTGDCPQGKRRGRRAAALLAVAGAGALSLSWATVRTNGMVYVPSTATSKYEAPAIGPHRRDALSSERLDRIEEAFGTTRAVMGRIARPEPPAIAAGPLTASLVQRIELPRAFVRRLLDTKWTPVGALPLAVQTAGGRPAALRIRSVDERFEKMGFRVGDLVRTANGQPVADPDAALRIYEDLRSARRVVVELERAGTPVVLIFELTG